jgi:branched-chain amino acid transport system substrate-binding protein
VKQPQRNRLSWRNWPFALGLLILAQSAGAQDIAIGQLASMTNPISASGAREHYTGLRLAVDRVNAAGGLFGRRVSLLLEDDNYDAAKSAVLAEKLVMRDGIVALVGCFGTQPLLRLAKDGFFERHKIASVAPLTGLQSALGLPNVFPGRASYEDEIAAMLRHAKQLGRKRVAFLHFEAGVGKLLADAVGPLARQEGIELQGPFSYPVTDRSLQASAVTPAITKILAAGGSDALILVAAGAAHSEALRVVRSKIGSGLPVYSLSLIDPAQLISEVGLPMASGLMLTQVMPHPGSVSIGIVREFNADRAKFNASAALTYMTLEGYVAGRITLELIRRASAPTSQAILQAGLSAGSLSLSDFRLYYSPDRKRVLQSVDITMIARDGKLIR